MVDIKSSTSGKKYVSYLNYSHSEMEASTEYVRLKYDYFARVAGSIFQGLYIFIY